MKKYTFIVDDPGDSSVGIFPYHEEITVEFKHETDDLFLEELEMEESLKEFFKDMFDTISVLTEKEYNEIEKDFRLREEERLHKQEDNSKWPMDESNQGLCYDKEGHPYFGNIKGDKER